MCIIGAGQRALARVASSVSLGALLDARAARAQEAALELAEPARRAHALTPRVVLSLVLALNLWREKSIPEVLNQVLAPWGIRDPVSDGAISHARQRLGVGPVKRFFEVLSEGPPPPASFHGRRLRALDGVYLALPDTPGNAKAFGRPHCVHKGRPLPHVLLVTLSDVATHRMRGASIHPCRTGERDAGLALLGSLGRGDLVLIDRGFYSAPLLRALEAQGLEYVVRVPASVRPDRVSPRGEGDADVVIRTRYRRERARRAGRRRWDRRSEAIEVRGRLIRYRVGHGRAPVRLLTNVADVGAQELADLYHMRWEIELAYDEIKTHLAAVRHGVQDVPVRSRSPQLVEQEVWALLALYDLLRLAMAEAAAREGIDPRSLSFTKAVELVRAARAARAGARPRGRRTARTRLLLALATCTMRRWRRNRRCPRAVRARRNPFPGKTRYQRESPCTARAVLCQSAA